MEAAREGSRQNVSFDTPFQIGERELSVKKYFVTEQDEDEINPKGITISGTDVYSEEELKIAWMRETRSGLSCR